MTAMAATAPMSGRIRGYYAPVDRVSGYPTLFDPAVLGRFDLDAPPAGWTDLGWIHNFRRTSETKVMALEGGAPLATRGQTRKAAGAEVALEFESWGKLQMGLSAGSQHMNLLAVASGAAAKASGGAAQDAIPLESGSTAASLAVTDASGFAEGDVVAVDADYAGEVGYIGAGVSAAWLQSSDQVNNDAHYLRRVTYNVARVTKIDGNALTLASPLPAGVPASEMKVAKVLGFVDREGGSFFHEWSALFVMDGVQGDRVLYHYPRLQTASGAAEASSPVLDAMQIFRLAARFRALPVRDANDGEQALCFRSYLPAAMRQV